MNIDRLSRAERMNALIMRGKLDRVPVNAGASTYAAAIAGICSKDFYLEPEKAIEAGLWSLALHQYDSAPSYNIPEWSGWDFGGEIVFPTDPKMSLPHISKRAVQAPGDVEKLHTPGLDSAPAFSRMFRFAKLARVNGFGASFTAGSPMGIAGAVIGPDLLMRWIRKEPGLVHRVLRLATDLLFEIADRYIAEFGVENCTACSSYPFECHALGTGYGRISLPFIDKAVTEITCHARGAHHLLVGADMVIDIGGQDSKVILTDGRGGVINFAMNDKCAAGTGRFLEVIAAALGADVSELAEKARGAEPVQISSMCTVFAESEVISLLAQGVDKGKIIAGIHRSVANRVAAMAERLGQGELIIFTGGVAKNEGVKEFLSRELRRDIVVAPESQLAGALGAALLAREKPVRKEK